MRIGIDITPLAGPRTGVGHFCASLLNHLLRMNDPDFSFRGLSSGLHKPMLNGPTEKLVHRHLPLPTRSLYWAWTAFQAPKVDRLLGGVDVYHATNYFLPPTKSARRIVTVYDVAFLIEPAWCSPKVVGPFAAGLKRFVADADAVLTCSAATKHDLVRMAGISEDKVTVTPGAVDTDFAPAPKEDAIALLAERHGLTSPFLLFVGTLEPRKNIPAAIRAFASVADRIPHHLVLVGPEGWGATAVFDAIDRHRVRARVHHVGYVPREDLPLFYSAADAFVFPSLYEGFGLPVLEAMACGCPVVASNRASLPEVAGDAALLVDPEQPDALAQAIERILSDLSFREMLIARGHARVRQFSWAHCAETTLAAYRSLA